MCWIDDSPKGLSVLAVSANTTLYPSLALVFLLSLPASVSAWSGRVVVGLRLSLRFSRAALLGCFPRGFFLVVAFWRFFLVFLVGGVPGRFDGLNMFSPSWTKLL